MNPIEIIKERKSCRSYLLKKIDSDVKGDLIQYLQKNSIGLFGETVNFQLIEKNDEDYKNMKLDYGIITNHRNYIAGATTGHSIIKAELWVFVRKNCFKSNRV